jgi:hypothetical protein
VADSPLEPANSPPSVGIFADDLPASVILHLRVINRVLEFDPQSCRTAGKRCAWPAPPQTTERR